MEMMHTFFFVQLIPNELRVCENCFITNIENVGTWDTGEKKIILNDRNIQRSIPVHQRMNHEWELYNEALFEHYTS